MSSLFLSSRCILLWVSETAKDGAASLKMMTISCKMAQYTEITIRVQAVM